MCKAWQLQRRRTIALTEFFQDFAPTTSNVVPNRIEPDPFDAFLIPIQRRHLESSHARELRLTNDLAAGRLRTAAEFLTLTHVTVDSIALTQPSKQKG